MGDVVRLRRPRRVHLRGATRTALTEAMTSVREPVAIVIVVLGKSDYSLRTVSSKSEILDIDMFGRAGAIIDRERIESIE